MINANVLVGALKCQLSSFQTLARAWHVLLCAQYKPSCTHVDSPHSRTRSSLTCSHENFYFCQSWGGACCFNCNIKCHWLFPFSRSQYWTPVIRWFIIHLTWDIASSVDQIHVMLCGYRYICAFAAHTSYQKRLNKVLSFVVMDCYASKDFLCISRHATVCCVWNNVCACV